jgi:hypothetical protein
VELRYLISADFGQAHDFTAVAVMERRLEPVGEPYAHTEEWTEHAYGPVRRSLEARQKVEQHYDLLRLDRPPLRTSYKKIARGLVKLIREFYVVHVSRDDYVSGGAKARPSVGLAVDATGVGRGVYDDLMELVHDPKNFEDLWREDPRSRGRLHIPVFAATIHGGTKTTKSRGFFNVSKTELVNAGIVAYQEERLHIGKLRYRETLEEELTNYRLKQNIATGHVGFEPLREGQHDDLVFAVCLGAWTFDRALAKQEHIKLPAERLSGWVPA